MSSAVEVTQGHNVYLFIVMLSIPPPLAAKPTITTLPLYLRHFNKGSTAPIDYAPSAAPNMRQYILTSYTIRTPSPSLVAALTLSSHFSSKLSNYLSLSSLPTIAIASAPTAFAICTAITPRPPEAPSISAVSPAFSFATDMSAPYPTLSELLTAHA